MKEQLVQEFLRNWEAGGAIFIILTGSLLHFVFDLTGRWPPIALIAAVNESVWEHLKLAFWPCFFFALISIPVIRDKTENFLIAKTAAMISMPVVIVVLFYAYVLIFKHHNLIYDIGIFIIAVILGQAISYRLLLKPRFAQSWQIISVILLLMATAAFTLLSYFPPRWPIFRESSSGHYGLPIKHRSK